MGKNTPLQRVNEEHGGKEKLVDTLVGLLDRGDEDKAAFKRRLLAASNTKLLRLHHVNTSLKDRFGDKDALVDSLLKLMNRLKDGDYRNKLRKHNATRLFALHRDWEKKAKAAARTR